MKKVKCPLCRGTMEKIKDRMPEDNVEFEAYRCKSCGEELMNMGQMGVLAAKYRALRKAKESKFQKWGNSLAVRIPKQIADDLHIVPEKSCLILKEKGALKILVT